MMTKKYVTAIAMIMTVILMFTGCTNKSEETAKEAPAATEEVSGQDDNDISENDAEQEQPDVEVSDDEEKAESETQDEDEQKSTDDAAEEKTEPEEADNSKKAEAGFPEYVYTGDEEDKNFPYMKVICEHILDSEGVFYGRSDVLVPIPYTYEIDDSDKSLVKVWGYFGFEHYDLEDKTLVFKDGGFSNEYLELEKDGDSYKVGKNLITYTDDDWIDIIKETGKSKAGYKIDEKKVNKLRTEIIKNYIDAGKDTLPEITGYNTYGDVIKLK